MKGPVIVAVIIAGVLGVYALINVALKDADETNKREAAARLAAAVQEPVRAPEPIKKPCPVKLVHSSLVHHLEEDVGTTVVNTSDREITAIALGVAHTDNFGETWEPYKTDLTSEQSIRAGRSRSMQWEILMTTRTSEHGGKPGTSGLYVDKVAFGDGAVLRAADMVLCEFRF